MRLLKLANAALRMRRRELTFVSFNVTNRCTQRCPMCGVWSAPSDELPVAEIIEIFTGLRRAGAAVIEVSGGEPFLRPDIFEILEAFDRLGYLYTVTTNGTLLTPEILDRLGTCTGLLQLAVSLDSLDCSRYERLRGVDSLPRVLESLDMIAASGRNLPVKLNVTMSRVNRDEILDILACAKERRLGMSVFPVVQGAGLAHRADDDVFSASESERREMADLFRHLVRLRRSGEPLWEYSGYYEVAAEYVMGHSIGTCDAGRVFLDVRANGDLAACVDLPAVASLRAGGVARALALVEGERKHIRRCSENTPCCYTCTANITQTARHPLRYAFETARVRLRASRA